MRPINLVVIHCSASDVHAHDDVETVRRWHLDRGWSDIGYHYFINKRGVWFPGRKEETPGAHVRGHNQTSIGICLSGLNEFKDEQFFTAADLAWNVCRKYNLQRTDIVAHNELDPGKTCPNFNMQEIFSRMRPL